MRFKYTHKNSNEILGYVKADSKLEAEILASKRKQMELKDFLKIFKVEKHD